MHFSPKSVGMLVGRAEIRILVSMAANVIPAIDFLLSPEGTSVPLVCAVVGDEEFLRRRSLQAIRRILLPDEDDEFSLTELNGPDTDWRELAESLVAMSLFGGRRVVILENADKLITRFRDQFEDYVSQPDGDAIFVIEVSSMPKNTRIYKMIAKEGLVIDCKAPRWESDSARWIARWAEKTHNVKIRNQAAELLFELVGPELGLVDQEITKLALTVGSDRRISDAMIERSAGNWRTKTAWAMLDMFLAGHVTEGLEQLDRLLAAGEHPVALTAQIASTLRRFARAARIVVRHESLSEPISVENALAEAGVNRNFVKKSAEQLKRLGRERALKLSDWLMQLDLNLKGGSQLKPRLVLEEFLLKIAVPWGQV